MMYRCPRCGSRNINAVLVGTMAWRYRQDKDGKMNVVMDMTSGFHVNHGDARVLECDVCKHKETDVAAIKTWED